MPANPPSPPTTPRPSGVILAAAITLASTPAPAYIADLSHNPAVPLHTHSTPLPDLTQYDPTPQPRRHLRRMSPGDGLQAFSETVSRYFVSLNLDIPDNSSVGVTSEKVVNGIAGVIGSVQVQLNIAPTPGSTMFNGDLLVTLSHDSGYAVLLNRPGRRDGFSAGYGDNGFQITLSDSAAADVHTYRIQATGSHTTPLSLTDTPAALTGSWQPDGRTADPSQVGVASPRNATLDQFAGLDPNGVWTLHLADLAQGGQARLVEWSLHFTMVPEPRETFLATCALLASLALLRSTPGSRHPSR